MALDVVNKLHEALRERQLKLAEARRELIRCCDAAKEEGFRVHVEHLQAGSAESSRVHGVPEVTVSFQAAGR